MWRWLFVFAFALGALFFRPAPALAGMHFCNKTPNTVWVAMATLDEFFDARVWGWFKFVPDECGAVISADLDTTGDIDYHYYAYDNSGDTWTGDETFCVDPSNAFDFNDKEESDCATGVHRKFKTIQTNNEADYTVSLTV